MITNLPATSATDIRDIKPPVAIPNVWEWVGWVLADIGGSGNFVFRVAMLAKTAFANSGGTAGAGAHARETKTGRKRSRLITQPKPFCILVSDTIRSYLEEQFDFHAPERTTEEFLQELQRDGFVGAGTKGKPRPISGELRPGEVRQIRTGRTGIARTAWFGRPAGRRNRTESSPKSRVHSPKSISAGMNFAHPYFLLLLLLLPLLAWLKGRRGSPPAFLYSSVRLVEGLTRVRRSRAGAFLAALRWLVLALFILALAQPRLAKSQTEVKASGIDIVVAFDMSGSMTRRITSWTDSTSTASTWRRLFWKIYREPAGRPDRAGGFCARRHSSPRR